MASKPAAWPRSGSQTRISDFKVDLPAQELLDVVASTANEARQTHLDTISSSSSSSNSRGVKTAAALSDIKHASVNNTPCCNVKSRRNCTSQDSLSRHRKRPHHNETQALTKRTYIPSKNVGLETWGPWGPFNSLAILNLALDERAMLHYGKWASTFATVVSGCSYCKTYGTRLTCGQASTILGKCLVNLKQGEKHALSAGCGGLWSPQQLFIHKFSAHLFIAWARPRCRRLRAQFLQQACALRARLFKRCNMRLSNSEDPRTRASARVCCSRYLPLQYTTILTFHLSPNHTPCHQWRLTAIYIFMAE